jgi:hypothetical protein
MPAFLSFPFPCSDVTFWALSICCVLISICLSIGYISFLFSIFCHFLCHPTSFFACYCFSLLLRLLILLFLFLSSPHSTIISLRLSSFFSICYPSFLLYNHLSLLICHLFCPSVVSLLSHSSFLFSHLLFMSVVLSVVDSE